MSQSDQTNIVGLWIAEYAENVQDMGRRVAEVLRGNPRDHHYAGDKLSTAINDATKALALAGWTREQLVELVTDAHENGLRYKRDLERELSEAPR